MLILETHAMNEKEAMTLSARYLGVEASQISLQVIKKGSSGFLGLGAKKPSLFRIEAIKNVTPVQAVVKGVIATILHKMGYKAKFLKFEAMEDGKTYVELSSPHAGYIIGKRGRSLEALQFLVNLMVQQYIKEPPRVLLDIENYRERRAKHLTDLAMKVAETVVKTGKSRLLDPLNPYERRLVHMALQEDIRVETESEGTGVYKRVRVRKKGDTTDNGEAESVSVDDDLGGEAEGHEFDDSNHDNFFDEEESRRQN